MSKIWIGIGKINWSSSIFNFNVISDVNECDSSNGGCEHTCKNTEGAHYCLCNTGYQLQTDDKSCKGNLR